MWCLCVLACVQWNLSIEGTIGTQLAVLFREVYLPYTYALTFSGLNFRGFRGSAAISESFICKKLDQFEQVGGCKN